VQIVPGFLVVLSLPFVELLQVLATSLNAMYSELPTVQVLNCDEWSSVTEHIRCSVPSLSAFVQCLQFCNSVIQVGICSLHADCSIRVFRAPSNAVIRDFVQLQFK